MDFGGGEVTGIKAMDKGQSTKDNKVYDLLGRPLSIINSQLSIPKKGVYVVNGRKVVVK